MHMNFECHITCDIKDEKDICTLLESSVLGSWKLSKIDGDPLLGARKYLYLTCHGSEYTSVYEKMKKAVYHLVNNMCPVYREKIELIMHDIKY